MPSIPQITGNEGKQGLRRKADTVGLGFDKAVFGVNFAGLHQTLPALDALAVTPAKGDMIGESRRSYFVIGISQNTFLGSFVFGVLCIA